MNILFVCTGNTCRSVIAESILKDNFFVNVSSAGLYADGEPVSKNAKNVLEENGIKCSKEFSERLTFDKIKTADVIFTMTESQKKEVKKSAEFCGEEKKVYSFSDLIGKDIEDPYGQDEDSYKKCFTDIEKGCREILNKFIKNVKEKNMKIAIGNDHGGIELKFEILKILEKKGIEYENFGTDTKDSVDYPDYALKVAKKVANKEFDFGILVCGTGLGVSITANKVKGIRCALCGDTFSAKMARMHNNANILALGERVIGKGLMSEILEAFLTSEFEGGRHAQRVNKIIAIEEENFK